MPRASLADRRLMLGHAAVLSVDEAARLLGPTAAEARLWLAERRLISTGPGGVERVVWAWVIEELDRGRARPADGSGGIDLPRRQPRARGGRGG